MHRFAALFLAALGANATALDGPNSACSCGVVNVDVAHTGTPTGQMKKANGVDMYIAYPANKKTENAILYLPDIFGVQLVQNKLLADSFAKAGYLVVEPDLFEGDPAPADLASPAGRNMGAWMAKHTVSKIDSIIAATIKHMREDLGVKRIGTVGYCFGGKYVARFLAKGKGVDAGFMAHPSSMQNDEIEAISSPLSIGAAETDNAFPAPKRHDAEVTLKKLGVPYQISLYGSVSHGFGVRANVSDKRAKFAKEEAYLQAVRWFDTWVKP